MAGLTVLIPTLNEASRLSLLLADLAHWPHALQVLVVMEEAWMPPAQRPPLPEHPC